MEKKEIINIINSMKKYSPLSDEVIGRTVKAFDDRVMVNKRIEILNNTILNSTFNDILNGGLGAKIISEFNEVESLAHKVSMESYAIKKAIEEEISEEEYMDNDALYEKIDDMLSYDPMVSKDVFLLHEVKRTIDTLFDEMEDSDSSLTIQSDFFESFNKLANHKRVL